MLAEINEKRPAAMVTSRVEAKLFSRSNAKLTNLSVGCKHRRAEKKRNQMH